MDCLCQLIILCTCLLLVVASRYSPQQHDERLHELEKWPFTTTTPSYSYKELTSYPFQPWKPPTTTENPQQVLAQMFKTKEISDMREPPKVNKNPLMFQNYDQDRQPPNTQKPNKIKNIRNSTRAVSANKRTTSTTTTKPAQTTTPNSRTTTTNSPDSIIFKDNEPNTVLTTPPQTSNATDLEVNHSNSNDTKANTTRDGFGTQIKNQDTNPQEATTEAPAQTVNVTVALTPVETIQTAVPNQAVIIQAINPALQVIPANPTLNTANVPQYILGNNQLTLSTSSAVNTQSNHPTLYTIVTVPNSQQQIIVQSSNTPNSISQNPMQIDIKNTDPNVNFVQNKEPAAAVSQLTSNNQQFILVSSPNQPVSQMPTSNNQLMVIQVPNNQYQVPNNQYQAPNNQMQVPSNQYQVSNNQYQVPNNQYQVPNNQIQVPSNQIQVPSNQIQVPSNQFQIPNNQVNLVQNPGNVPMVLNNRMQDPSTSYFLVETPKSTNSASVSSNNVPYTNTVMVSISG